MGIINAPTFKRRCHIYCGLITIQPATLEFDRTQQRVRSPRRYNNDCLLHYYCKSMQYSPAAANHPDRCN